MYEIYHSALDWVQLDAPEEDNSITVDTSVKALLTPRWKQANDGSDLTPSQIIQIGTAYYKVRTEVVHRSTLSIKDDEEREIVSVRKSAYDATPVAILNPVSHEAPRAPAVRPAPIPSVPTSYERLERLRVRPRSAATSATGIAMQPQTGLPAQMSSASILSKPRVDPHRPGSKKPTLPRSSEIQPQPAALAAQTSSGEAVMPRRPSPVNTARAAPVTQRLGVRIEPPNVTFPGDAGVLKGRRFAPS